MLFSSTSSECHIIEHVIIVAFVYRHLNCRVNFFFFCFHFRSHSIFDVRVKRVGQISGVTFASKMHKNWYKSHSWMEFVLLLLVILNIAFVYSFNRLLHFFYTDILITFSPNQSGWRRFSCCIRDWGGREGWYDGWTNSPSRELLFDYLLPLHNITVKYDLLKLLYLLLIRLITEKRIVLCYRFDMITRCGGRYLIVRGTDITMLHSRSIANVLSLIVGELASHYRRA